MCGINALINIGSKINLQKKIVEMNKLIQHRGPDDSGVYVSINKALGHTRLSIIDLTSAGHQPMVENDQLRIVFNGEIYNYLEIRSELLSLGYNFTSNSDTEVILKAYSEWGEDCVTKFNGMWAFVIFDELKSLAFCSRDRFGIKPFYYNNNDGSWIISSEIKPILSFFDKVEADEKSIANYLVLDICDESERTFFKNIKRLKGGHNLLVNLKDGSHRISRYYNLKHEKTNNNDEFGMVFNLMKSSVNLRLRSDVRVGSCLSGGLDSSFISSLASKQYTVHNDKKFLAFTAQSSDPANDETKYAKKVVDYANMDWIVSKSEMSDFFALLDEVIYTQEEPFRSPSIFLQYEIMSAASNAKCKVLLDGQGGDETFLGYERYYMAVIRSLPIHKRIQAFTSMVKNSKVGVVNGVLLYFYMTSEFLRRVRTKKRASIFRKSLLKKVNWGYLSKLNERNLEQLQKNEIEHLNLPALLRYEDKNSMKFAIETRLPFLDYRVVEYAIGLPHKAKINNGWTKFAIRKAGDKVLPNEIAWRKNKVGFEPPTSQWFNDQNPFIEEIKRSPLLTKLCKSIPSTFKDTAMLWRLFNVARWEKLYNVQQNKD